MFVYKLRIHDVKTGPKLNFSRHLKRNGHSMLSNAFSKSINVINPGVFCSFVKRIISSVVLIASPMYLPFM